MGAMDVGLGTDLLLKRKNKMLIRKQNKGTNAISGKVPEAYRSKAIQRDLSSRI
jgi:ligand-binding sensor domain-containing protein